MISADESFKPLLDAEKNIFEADYNKAEVIIGYKAESEALNDLYYDSVEVIVIGRDLNTKERDFFKQKSFPVASAKICSDALVFIVHNDFPDSILKYDDIRKIFQAKVSRWGAINKNFQDSSIQIILDQSSSGNLQTLNNLFTISSSSLNIFAAGSNKAVTEFVKTHKYSLGVIGSSWVSDREDPGSRQLMKGLKILSVQKNDTISGPWQGDLVKAKYPFCRNVYMINSNKKAGVANAFISFVSGDRGQRIVLKSGLLPAAMPGREIRLK
jgi:phosphate transport system substrate-binding protein